MKLRSCVAWTVFTLALSFVSSAQAQTATFYNVNDAVPGMYFNSATTAADRRNPNKLILGFNTGFDAKTFLYRAFRATTVSFHRTSAMDTISFRVKAPLGYYLSRITYIQRGAGSTGGTGKVSGGSQWVVNGTAIDLGLFKTTPTLTSTIDLTGRNWTDIPVSITTGLFVFATPSLGSASIIVSGADVLVELLPQP